MSHSTSPQRLGVAQNIMLDFARETGLSDPAREARRYLWTDAFAVCNFLELYHQTSRKDFLQLALDLVDQVHATLGKHHPDSTQKGWLSGLDDEQARMHPTIAGLRIGKKMIDRPVDEPFDEQLEWDRDGQYFHYLTKWMHALNRVSRVTKEARYHRWAVELASAAYDAFVYSVSDENDQPVKRMVWKMSIDLTRPVVDSMGHHDPLDGLMTYLELETYADTFVDSSDEADLKTAIEDFRKMCAGKSWATADSLGVGGLLTDAYRLTQLLQLGAGHLAEATQLGSLLHDVELSLQAFATQNQLNLPAEYRLAFRELGLAIGLHAIGKMQTTIEQNPDCFLHREQLNAALTRLNHYQRIQTLIEDFWLQDEHRHVESWVNHADINQVMLATSLIPDGFLLI